jgi:regulatory protein
MVRRRPPDAPPPSGSARLAALRLLGRREYTVAELETRLLARGYPAEDVASAITGLCADRTIDDARVALDHVRTASAIKGRGRLRIRRELQARGIDRGIIETATADLTGEDERHAIDRFVQRRVGGRPLDQAARRKLYQQLIRRGFPAGTVVRVLREAGSAASAEAAEDVPEEDA